MPVFEVLKRVQLFTGLNDDELQQLAAICIEKQISPGEIIIEQNTTGTELFIVAAGTTEIFIQGVNDAHSLVVLGKGQVIGEMALIDQGYRSASARATKEGALLYQMDNDSFNHLCRQNNHIGYIVMRNMSIDLAFKLRHRNLTAL